jgi:hypothetical protein
MMLADAEDKTNNEKSKVGLVLIKNNQTKKWEVISMFGFNASLHNFTENKINNDYSTIAIKDIGIKFPLHKSFEQVQSDSSQYNYFMKGKTPRDSALQIVYFPKKDNLLLLSQSWVKYNLQDKRFTPPVISYFSNGYKYECQIVGSDNIPNKMIVIALENNGNYIFINFFSYLQVYKEKYSIFDNMLKNIVLTK